MAPRGRKDRRNPPSVEAHRPRKPTGRRTPPTEETHEMVKNENCVDENESHGQSGKDAMSRCSSTYFRKVINKLEPKLCEKQQERIRSTPFAKWLKMPKLSIYSTRVDAILKRFVSDSSSFIFGKDIVAPFTSLEFSIVLGLPHSGQPVDLDLRMKSNFLSRYFAGKLSNATRKKISENLLLLAGLDDDSQLDDFIRMFILFALNCIVFPLSTYMTPRFVFSYIDDLPNFFEYSWGEAAYRFLCDNIDAHIGNSEGTVARKTYLDGCVVGMMAWVYEKVPSLGVLSGSPRTFPRLFKWGESKIPLKAEDAEALLNKITRTKVLNITPFGDELQLFGEKQGYDRVSSKLKEAETTCKIRRLEKLVEDQLHEIRTLRQMCCVRDGVMEKEIVGGRADGESDEDKNDGRNVPVADEAEDFDKDLGGYNENWDVDVVADFKGDGATFTELAVEENKIGTDDSSREVVDKSDSANGVAGSQKDTVSNVISSIAKHVMTRTDRVKKRKPDMFVSPPNSTPTCKTKSIVQDKDFTVLSDEGDTSIENQRISDDKAALALNTYKGREDFCGSTEISDEDHKIIMRYLTWEKLGGTVWEGERFKVRGPQLCDLLFGNEIRDDIINCYMQIVSIYSQKNGFEILCMDTAVQDEVLNALERFNKKRMLKDDCYHDFLSQLTNYSRGKLEELNKNLKERCRFLLFPINRQYHWFLLVYKIEKREFELRNSIHTSQALGTARVYAKFLVGYMRIMFGYHMEKPVKRVLCRQQSGTVDCGIFTCLWAECYARDDDGAWTYEKECTMNSIRARIAATILSDKNGVFSKES